MQTVVLLEVVLDAVSVGREVQKGNHLSAQHISGGSLKQVLPRPDLEKDAAERPDVYLVAVRLHPEQCLRRSIPPRLYVRMQLFW